MFCLCFNFCFDNVVEIVIGSRLFFLNFGFFCGFSWWCCGLFGCMFLGFVKDGKCLLWVCFWCRICIYFVVFCCCFSGGLSLGLWCWGCGGDLRGILLGGWGGVCLWFCLGFWCVWVWLFIWRWWWCWLCWSGVFSCWGVVCCVECRSWIWRWCWRLRWCFCCVWVCIGVIVIVVGLVSFLWMLLFCFVVWWDKF